MFLKLKKLQATLDLQYIKHVKKYQNRNCKIYFEIKLCRTTTYQQQKPVLKPCPKSPTHEHGKTLAKHRVAKTCRHTSKKNKNSE